MSKKKSYRTRMKHAAYMNLHNQLRRAQNKADAKRREKEIENILMRQSRENRERGLSIIEDGV